MLGILSSQLTNSYFSEGLKPTTNQIINIWFLSSRVAILFGVPKLPWQNGKTLQLPWCSVLFPCEIGQIQDKFPGYKRLKYTYMQYLSVSMVYNTWTSCTWLEFTKPRIKHCYVGVGSFAIFFSKFQWILPCRLGQLSASPGESARSPWQGHAVAGHLGFQGWNWASRGFQPLAGLMITVWL